MFWWYLCLSCLETFLLSFAMQGVKKKKILAVFPKNLTEIQNKKIIIPVAHNDKRWET